MKKLFTLLLFTLIILSSCSDSSTKKTTSTLTTYTGSGYLIKIPKTWDIIIDKDKILPKPSIGKIELAVTSKEETDGFSNNLLILSTKIGSGTTSSNFSISNNNGIEKKYLNYRLKSKKDLIFNDLDKSIIYNFRAKYNPDTPTVQFLQTTHICEDQGFLLTFAISEGLEDVRKYESLLKSFKCVN